MYRILNVKKGLPVIPAVGESSRGAVPGRTGPTVDTVA